MGFLGEKVTLSDFMFRCLETFFFSVVGSLGFFISCLTCWKTQFLVFSRGLFFPPSLSLSLSELTCGDLLSGLRALSLCFQRLGWIRICDISQQRLSTIVLARCVNLAS